MKWITLPPVVAIFTIMVARSMGSGTPVGEVDLSIWAMVWLLLIVLSALYGMYIVHGFNAGLVSLQAIVQGMLLCPMSIVYGAKMFQWLGVLLAVCGAAALVVIYNQHETERNKVVVVDVEDDLKKLPVNFAITDDTGVILNMTDNMLEALGLDRLNSLGKNISDWFSPVAKTAEINGKIWDVKRVTIDNGRRYYFEIAPKGLPATNDEIEAGESQNSGQPVQFIDPDTQLHTYRYGMARISDELYRAGRYNHAVSALMIRLVFPPLAHEDNMEKYIRPFRSYCARVMKDIRQADTAIQTGESQLLVVLSECPYQMVDDIAQRLMSIGNALVPTFEEFLHVTMLNVSETIEGGSNVPSAQELVDRMTQAMTRKYSANALSE